MLEMDEQIRIVTLCHIAIFGICKVMQQQKYGKLREIQCPQWRERNRKIILKRKVKRMKKREAVMVVNRMSKFGQRDI